MILDRFQENGSKYVFVFSIVDNLQIQIVCDISGKKESPQTNSTEAS